MKSCIKIAYFFGVLIEAMLISTTVEISCVFEKIIGNLKEFWAAPLKELKLYILTLLDFRLFFFPLFFKNDRRSC